MRDHPSGACRCASICLLCCDAARDLDPKRLALPARQQFADTGTVCPGAAIGTLLAQPSHAKAPSASCRPRDLAADTMVQVAISRACLASARAPSWAPSAAPRLAAAAAAAACGRRARKAQGSRLRVAYQEAATSTDDDMGADYYKVRASCVWDGHRMLPQLPLP